MEPSLDAADARLKSALAAGQSAAALSLFIDAHGAGVLAFLCSRLRSVHDGREAYALFLEDVWKGLPSFMFRCSSRTWAYTLARNAANRFADASRRRRVRNDPLSEHPSVLQRPAAERTATEVHLRTSVKQQVRELRERLPEQDHTLLVLHVDRGMSFRDIAEVLHGGPLAEVERERETARLRKRFERVKQQLRAWAVECGLLPGETC